MKPLLVAATIVLAVPATGGRAEAQNYPWCAYYANDLGENCGFATYEQCMENVPGIGGSCERNTQYGPPAAGGPGSTLSRPPRPPRHKRSHP